ncbi:MAG TPA: hypothetical protein VN578_03925 [Candidatus Binatia bacterium]|jgi:hypothetical protein|nr:hypothetical protein [Candidatus Binatia bacterium]
MTRRIPLSSKRASGLALALWLPAAIAFGADAKATSPSAPNTLPNPVAAINLSEIPQSTFVFPSTPKEGRNPFFPLSTAGLPVPTKPRENVVDTTSIVLNGITPSGPKRTAMINSYTFEEGEEHEVRLASGSKEMIKCVEIKSDSATISVRGQRRELRLRTGVF